MTCGSLARGGCDFDPLHDGPCSQNVRNLHQLTREHYEGIAADRLEAERRQFTWDIEGWDGDELLLYIAGSGLHRIPLETAEAMANAMLSECQIYREEKS